LKNKRYQERLEGSMVEFADFKKLEFPEGNANSLKRFQPATRPVGVVQP
jgi:hypothetical protein